MTIAVDRAVQLIAEKAAKPPSTRGRFGRKKTAAPAAKASTAKKPTAKKPVAKKATTKKTTAKKAASDTGVVKVQVKKTSDESHQ